MKHKRYIPITRRRNRRRIRSNRRRFAIYMAICLLLIGVGQIRMPDRLPSDTGQGIIRELSGKDSDAVHTEQPDEIEEGDIPEYSGRPYIEVNDNTPDFSDADKEALSSPDMSTTLHLISSEDADMQKRVSGRRPCLKLSVKRSGRSIQADGGQGRAGSDATS